MIEDPIVDEIHRYRREHAAKYGNDLKKIAEALKEFERTSGREYINREPRRIPVQKVSEEPASYGSSGDPSK